MRREKLSPFLAETLLQLLSGRGRISFLKGMTSQCHCVDGLATKNIWAAQIGLDDFSKNIKNRTLLVKVEWISELNKYVKCNLQKN